MATIIDELVLRLDLDPKKFDEGSKKAIESLRKMQEVSQQHAKKTEENTEKLGGVFDTLSRKALTFGALLVGGHTLESFTAHVVTTDAAVGRLARTMGLPAAELKKWQLVAESVGGSVVDTLTAMNSELNAAGMGILNPQTITLLNALPKPMGLFKAPGVPYTATEFALKLSENFPLMSPRTQSFFGEHFGMDPATQSMFAGGPASLQKQLAEAQKRYQLSEENVKASQKVQTAWHEATQALEGLGASIIHFTETAIIPFLNGVTAISNVGSKFINAGANVLPTDEESIGKTAGWVYWLYRQIGGEWLRGGAAKTSSGGSGNDSIMAGIASIESPRHGYSELGPIVKSGDRAYGKYQVMGNNISEWTKAALGKSMSAEEFLANPSAQDAVFKHRFGQYLNQYGNLRDAASMWFTGNTAAKGAGNQARDAQGRPIGLTGSQYVDQFMKTMGSGGANVSHTDVRIGTINVQTQASDAQGIAKDLRPVIERRQTVTQTNTGLE